MVTCVLISEEEGHVSEIESQLKSDTFHILKGTPTFAAQYDIPGTDDVIVAMTCDVSQFRLMENRNTLPPPFEGPVLGSILLVKMGPDAEPKDLTLSEVGPTLGLQGQPWCT